MDKVSEDPETFGEQPLGKNIRELLLKHAQTISPRAEHLVKSILKHFNVEVDQQEQNSDFINLQWDFHIQSTTISPICTKTVGYNGNTDKVFRCFDCLLTGNAIQCADCFSASDHKGHNYIQFFEGPGCCDCGNSEMWNEKGFCPSHTVKQTKISIDPAKQQLFHQQMQLSFWIYFWLNEEQKKKEQNLQQLIVTYIQQLLQNCNDLASQNYEYKVLLVDLFHSNFSESLPKLTGINKSILWSIFYLPINKQEVFKELFLNLTMQLFPVEKFRVEVIKIYFEKTKNDVSFSFNHPLRMVNFQFMTCLNTIIKLLKNGEIKPIIPFHITSLDSLENRTEYICTFIKHYDDLFYIQQMKKAREYNLIMMEQNDISESAYYRIFKQPLLCYADGLITLDDHYVKIMGLAIKTVADRKDLLEKQMRNLIRYVLNIQSVTPSMAQERLFAMMVTAYFDGDISQLRFKKVADKFIDMLDIGQLFPEKLKKLVFLGLYGIFHSRTQKLKSFTTFFAFEFFQQYDQLQLSLYLDIVYHKILFLLSKDIIDYGKVVEEVMGEIHQNELKIVIPEFLMMIKYGEIDELVVSYYLNMGNQEKLMAFYASLVEANKQKYGKEIKHIAGNIISCLKQFEWFIKNRTNMNDKGKIQNIIAAEPLVTCIYEAFFTGGFQEVYPNHIKTSEIYEELHIFTQKSLQEFKKVLLQTLNLPTPKIVNQRILLPCRLSRTLIKYYLIEQPQGLGDFFIEFVLPKCLQKGFIHLSSLINKIFSQKISTQSRETQRHDIDAADKKKKQRITKLKKQKEQKMKKQQQLHLNMHKDLQVPHEEVHEGLCILCRQDRQNEPLHLISSVDISDIIERSVFKLESYHIAIRTCGHKIHHKCFFDNNKNDFYKCFLCKRPTNILIPDYSSSAMQKTDLKKATTQFFDHIYLSLLQYRPDIEQHINNLMVKVNENLSAILQSFVYEIIGIQFEEECYFKRYVLPAYKAIFHLAQSLDYEFKIKAIDQEFDMLQREMKGTSFVPLLKYVNSKIRYSLMEKQQKIEEIVVKQKKDLTAINKIDQIFELLEGRDINFSFSDAEIKLTDKEREHLFYPIPQELSQLHTQRGECPQCNKFSSQILVCLQCGWKCCWDQLASIGKHSNTSHLNGCAFIKCYDGRVVYVYKDKALTATTIFENYLGEPFTSSKEMQNVHKFKVNRRKLEEVHRHIFNSEIREQVQK